VGGFLLDEPNYLTNRRGLQALESRAKKKVFLLCGRNKVGWQAELESRGRNRMPKTKDDTNKSLVLFVVFKVFFLCDDICVVCLR